MPRWPPIHPDLFRLAIAERRRKVRGIAAVKEIAREPAIRPLLPRMLR